MISPGFPPPREDPRRAVVITSVCMNRNRFLRVAAAEWVKLGVPIVVVDWSSREPVRETLRDFLDRVTVVEVPGKEFFHLAKSKNLSYRAAKRLHPDRGWILNFDCDVHARDPEAFFAAHPLDPQAFYNGGVDARRADLSRFTGEELRHQQEILRNKWATFGTFLCPLAALEAVNMNDERMEGYGMFDVDLYQRLRRSGLRWKRIAFPDLHHQPHANRTENYRQKDLNASMARNTRLMRRSWSRSFPQELQSVRIRGESLIL